MIELKNITKRFGKNFVYKNFDLTLQEGEITCVCGPSGCGKSTLLNILANITGYEGTITPKYPCSYIFQQPRLVPCLTVEENLKLVCGDMSQCESMLRRVGLEDKRKAYPIELSGGQAQRVSIARAFLHPAELILMDEPFSSLDTALKIKMIELFCDLWKEQSRSAVFVTHDVEEAYMLAQRVIVLKDGQITADFCEESAIPRKYGESSSFREKILQELVKRETVSENQ